MKLIVKYFSLDVLFLGCRRLQKLCIRVNTVFFNPLNASETIVDSPSNARNADNNFG